jgi:branched-chain amino acid transport system permease protein
VIRTRTTALSALALAVLAGFPIVVTNQFVNTIAFYTMLYVAAVSAWNLFSGYTGYISLGHAVFFGSGAYAAGIMARDLKITVGGWTELGLLPLAAAVAALVAVPFGLVALRVRRHTFVVVTIAIFFIFQLMAYDLAITGGTGGLDAPFVTWPTVPFDQRFFYLAAGLAVVAVVVSWLIRGSRFGLQLRAIRDDEDRAASLGVRAMPVKLTAFVISAAITGLAGGLWFFDAGIALPSSAFDPIFDLTIALMAFLGGLGTVSGPVLGALIIMPAELYLTSSVNNSYLSQLLLGALLLAVVLFLPLGAIPTVTAKFRDLTPARRAARS